MFTHQRVHMLKFCLSCLFRGTWVEKLKYLWLPLQCRRPRFDSWIGKICWRRDRLPTPVFLGFPGSAGKEAACNAGDLGLIPGLGRSPGEAKGYPLQYSGMENCMDYSPSCHKEFERLSDFHYQCFYHSQSYAVSVPITPFSPYITHR